MKLWQKKKFTFHEAAIITAVICLLSADDKLTRILVNICFYEGNNELQLLIMAHMFPLDL